MGTNNDSLKSVLVENRKFKPSQYFRENSNLKKIELERMCSFAERDYLGFWEDLARKNLTWKKTFKQTLEWNPPFAKWFLEGKLNASEQCLDAQIELGNGNKTALIWDSESINSDGLPTIRREYTYSTLLDEVESFASGLKKLDVMLGDRVVIYMPLIPEAVIAMLACARIGATHSVIFGGFSSEAIRDRIEDAKASVVITANIGMRRGKPLLLKENVDRAIEKSDCVRAIVVVDRAGVNRKSPYFEEKNSIKNTSPTNKRDHWYHDLLDHGKLKAVEVDSEHPLFILYTSGTTGKPKGVVHSTAGYMLWTKLTSHWIFDLKPNDIYWCTADIGWITGHNYVVYGPLSNGATVFMYEGAPDYPDFSRFWKIIEREKITIFYTAPTAIRTFMRQGDDFVKPYDLGSLRLLGSVGEPINPEAWIWYSKTIGGERCPVVDTWWQTETGGIMISPIPGVTETKPGSATMPLPGIMADVVDDKGSSVGFGNGGKLVIKKPWPSQLRTIYRDNARYQENYWSQFSGPNGFEKEPYYFTGDGCRIDKDGYFWIMGRIDDVLNVAGHRLGTSEIESALVSHPFVAEAAVVGKPDEIKGSSVFAFVTLKKIERSRADNIELRDKLILDLKAHVTKEIGSLARPDDIRFTDALPKTRSGKIMRRLLKDIAAGQQTVGDTSTLEDLSVLSSLRDYQE